MAGEKAGDVSVKDLESQYEMEGNVPAEGATGYGDDTEGALGEGTQAQEMPAVTGEEIERAASEHSVLDGMENDNLSIFKKEMELEAAKKAESEKKPDPEKEEETETPPEGEEAVPETEEVVEEATPELKEWLGSLEADDRQELFGAMLEDPEFRIQYNANDQTLDEPLSEVIRKAAGYEGQEAVRQRARDVAAQERQIQAQKAEIDKLKQQVEGFRDNLMQQVDDPAKFTKWLTDNSDLDYLRGLRDQLSTAVEEAETNPTAFNISRQVSGLESLVRRMIESQNGAATPGEPSGHSEGSQDGPKDTRVPKDFGFKPGAGYPEPYLQSAWNTLEVLVEGSRVTPAQAAQAWKAEGMRRPVFDVARDLMGTSAANVQKGQLAKTPPVMKRSARNRVTGKQVSKAATSGPRDIPFDQLESHLANEIRKAQQSGEL